MKIKLLDLHRFIRTELPPTLLRRYKRFEIVNESDLQFAVTKELRRFIRKDKEKRRLSVHNCLFIQASNTYPDVTVMKRGKPWLVIELKEKGDIREVTVFEERQKILRIRKSTPLKRAYVLYLGRWGQHRRLGKNKEGFKYWFFEVPVTLERDGLSKEKILEFERELHSRNKVKAAHA